MAFLDIPNVFCLFSGVLIIKFEQMLCTFGPEHRSNFSLAAPMLCPISLSDMFAPEKKILIIRKFAGYRCIREL